MKLSLSIFPVLLALGLGAVFPHMVRAGCYEDIGCTDRDYFTEFDLSLMNCRKLDRLRNSIYAENGYCFRKPKYQRIFGNEDCRFETASEVRLNSVERANVLMIVQVEREKGCAGVTPGLSDASYD